MDFMARYHEMKGEELVYPFGYDNNGLPTEKLALKEWSKRKRGKPMAMEIEGYSHEVADLYRDLFKQMSMAFRKEYHTSSLIAGDICRASFNDLKKKGLCYFADTEYYYCPKTKVSVSQSELTDDGRFERSGEKVIVKQGSGWFIKIKEHLPQIRKAIEHINWYPDTFRHRLNRWLDDLKYDWSISREREYGIEIPGETGMTFDTWFISSLTPQLSWQAHEGNQGYSGEEMLKCPIFDARFQAHDIIRTWALFTIVKSLYHNDQIPWRNIIISGHALDKKGHKISKSAGNFTPPQTFIDQYGSDGVRYWAAQNQSGTDTKTDVATMSAGKKLANKLRNACRFLEFKKGEGHNEEWMAAWKTAETEVVGHLDIYGHADALCCLRAFFWNEYCDQYIEASKTGPGRETLEQIMTEMIPYFQIFMPRALQTD